MRWVVEQGLRGRWGLAVRPGGRQVGCGSRRYADPKETASCCRHRRRGGCGCVVWGFDECRKAPEPLGAGFPGAEREVMESARLSEQTGCILDVHDWINERVYRVSGSGAWDKILRFLRFPRVETFHASAFQKG